jgi:twinkle protein
MYFSPENFPVSRHARKLIEKYSGYPFFKGYNPRIQKNEIDKYIDWLNSYFVFLNPGIEHRNLDYLLNQVNDVDGFVLDPWNEVEHSRPEGMTETEYIGQALSKLKALAIRENIHVWVVAHPTKLQKTIEGLYPVPTPYDISGSANWRNKADNCISIYRNTNEHKIQVHIQKIRFKDNGKPGMIELKYDPVTGRFN